MSSRLLGILFIVLSFSTTAVAQQSANEPEPEDATEQLENEQTAPSATTDNLPDIDSQPIQASDSGRGRFIPSEQISQDSGVSFPVDI